METLLANEADNQFRAPKKSLGDLDAEIAGKLIATAADIALVIDRKGVIRDVAFGGDELSREDFGHWLGRPWIDTVTVESRPKVEALLQDAAANAVPRWRQVNHPLAREADLPVLYAAMQVGDGRVVALGRDMRATASLQRRLVEAQQSVEREYARLRHAETRYRLLFQIASEAVLIVNAASRKVIEANPAAGGLLGADEKRLVGRSFLDFLDPDSAPAIEAFLTKVLAAGRADDVPARLANGEQEFLVSASVFRHENTSHFLIRLSPLSDRTAIAVSKTKSKLLKVVESLPDGFVVTDLDRRILVANSAFLDLAQLVSEEQARSEPLDRWLGRSGVDFNVLIASLREHGSVRHFGTVLRGEYGTIEQVEVSAVSVPNGEQPCFGFTIRNLGRRFVSDSPAIRELPHSVAQLTDLVGRVSLKELVRETTDVIERLCIEAALEMTGDNRASAAEMLGLSRQSLYAKLRRYGVDLDLDDED